MYRESRTKSANIPPSSKSCLKPPYSYREIRTLGMTLKNAKKLKAGMCQHLRWHELNECLSEAPTGETHFTLLSLLFVFNMLFSRKFLNWQWADKRAFELTMNWQMGFLSWHVLTRIKCKFINLSILKFDEHAKSEMIPEFCFLKFNYALNPSIRAKKDQKCPIESP